MKMHNNNILIALLSGLLWLAVSGQAGAVSGVETQRVSVDSLGNEGNNDSIYPSISANGRYVAFWSNASNLVIGDTNNNSDVFVYDRDTAQITRVSIDSLGDEVADSSAYPSISADGRYIAFTSWSDYLVAGDNNAETDVFVHDRNTGHTRRVSVDSLGGQGNGGSSYPAISADGRYVAFISAASNLVAGDTNATADIFVHDRTTGQTTRVSVDSLGAESNSISAYPSISADGRYVAFRSGASNLVPGDTNSRDDIFVHDRFGLTTRVSVDSSGNQSNNHSDWPSLSADGRYVTFHSKSTNLVTGDNNGYSHVFVHDRDTSQTTRVSVNSSGEQGNEHSNTSFQSTVSGDGRYVTFESKASNLVAGDTNGDSDIFIHDRHTGETQRVSVDSLGNQADWISYQPCISADGHYVAYYSYASNLVTGDTNGQGDVFVIKLLNNEQDFDGDDQPDLLLRNYDHGKNQIWFMNNVSKTGQAALPTIPDLSWRFEGLADFNADGHPDLLLRNHGHGANQIWLMQGSSKIGQSSLPRIPDTNWAFEGTGDFNGDGKPDIVLRNHSHGQNRIWYMNGTSKSGEAALPTIPDTNWYFEGVADFNGDKKPDLVLRNHSHGQNRIWYMNGTSKSGEASLPTIPDIYWTFQGASDFNSDFKPDLLLRNYLHGANQIWYMDGASKTGQAGLPRIPDTNWRIENR